MRNATISPWASLLICAYPFIEVIYSILRRSLQRRRLGQPDNQHMHSLISSQFIRQRFPALPRTLQNAAVAPLVWAAVAVLIALAFVFKSSTFWLAVTGALAMLVYHLVYRRLAARQNASQRLDAVAPPHAATSGHNGK